MSERKIFSMAESGLFDPESIFCIGWSFISVTESILFATGRNFSKADSMFPSADRSFCATNEIFSIAAEFIGFFPQVPAYHGLVYVPAGRIGSAPKILDERQKLAQQTNAPVFCFALDYRSLGAATDLIAGVTFELKPLLEGTAATELRPRAKIDKLSPE